MGAWLTTVMFTVRISMDGPEVDVENEKPPTRRNSAWPTNQPGAIPLQERDKQTKKETLER